MKNSEIMKTFGDNIRQRLTEYGWTIQDLANQTGINRSNISNILHGKEGCTLTRAYVIAAALEVPLSELVAETVAA